MYYEEQIINGVMSWRGGPTDEFTPYTAQELTFKLTELREAKKHDFELWCADASRLTKIKEIAEGQGTR